MAEFTSDIQHVAGSENVVADALSRPASSSSSRPLADPPGLITGACPAPAVIDWRGVANRQATCLSVQSTAASLSLQVEARPHEGVDLLCDISTGHVRPLIPVKDHLTVLIADATSGRNGGNERRQLLLRHVHGGYWAGLLVMEGSQFFRFGHQVPHILTQEKMCKE